MRNILYLFLLKENAKSLSLHKFTKFFPAQFSIAVHIKLLIDCFYLGRAQRFRNLRSIWIFMFNIHGGNKIENLCYSYFLHKHLCKFLFGDESILIDVKKSESNVRRILTPSFALDRIYLLELILSTFSFSNYFIYQVHLLTGQLCQLFLFRERVKKKIW